MYNVFNGMYMPHENAARDEGDGHDNDDDTK